LEATPFPYPDQVISTENVDQLVELARWGKGELIQVLWSPDGRLLAEAFSTGVYFYDAATLVQTGWIDTTTDVFTSLVFTPSGEALAAGFMDGTVQVWKVPSGELLQTFTDLRWQIGSRMAFTPDGATLVAFSSGEVSAWQLDSGRLWFAAPDSSSGFAMSPDGAWLAVPGEGKLVFYDLAEGTPQITLEYPGPVASPVYAPDGQTLALVMTDSASGAHAIQIIEAGFGHQVKTLDWTTQGETEQGRTGQAPLITTFSPDGSTLAAWTEGYGAARFWRTADWQPLLELEDREFAFSPDGRRLAAWSYTDPTIHLYRTADGRQSLYLPGSEFGVTRLLFSPAEESLAAVYGDGLLRLWNIQTGGLIIKVDEVLNDPHLLAFSPGKATTVQAPVLALSRGNGNLSLWRTKDGLRVETLLEQAPAITDLTFSPDGESLIYRLGDKGGCRLQAADGSIELCFKVDETAEEGERRQQKTVAALSPDGAFALALPDSSGLDTGNPFWLVDTAQPDREIELSLPFSLTLASFPADGKSVVLVSPHGQLAQYSTKDGSRVRRYMLPLEGEAEGDLRFEKMFLSPDGEWLVSSTSDMAIQVWKVSDGSLQYQLDFPLADPQAFAVTFSPDGSLLLASTPKQPVGWFNLVDGTPVQQMTLDDWFSQHLAVFPGSEILTSTAQNRLKFWQVSNGLPLGRLNALSWIAGVTLSPDGRLLATVTEDGVIQIWGLVSE
jgi:WD40 repeat protein